MRSALCSLVLLAACTSHGVRCDAHLMPINLPAPAQVPGTGAPAARAPAAGAVSGTPASNAPMTVLPPPEAR
jgi:hypothetical protein